MPLEYDGIRILYQTARREGETSSGLPAPAVLHTPSIQRLGDFRSDCVRRRTEAPTLSHDLADRQMRDAMTYEAPTQARRVNLGSDRADSP